jgi:hypothetical protein
MAQVQQWIWAIAVPGGHVANPQNFQRDQNGQRFEPGGIDTVHPLDALPPTKYAYLQNVRAYKQLQMVGRSTESAPVASPSLTRTMPALTMSSSTWTNPTNATSPSAYATYAGGIVNELDGATPALAIPAGATVTGIAISFNSFTTSSGSATPNLSIALSLAGATVLNYPIQTTQVGYLIGGQNFNWGLALTPALLNPGFTVELTASSLGGSTISVNGLAMTIYYSTNAPLITTPPVHSLRMLNDTTPNGPIGGYVRIVGAAGQMYVNAAEVASNLSGNPVSICPFRPNASPTPFAYIGDSALSVILTEYPEFVGSDCATGMLKIRSDGVTFKTGVKEPQLAPIVSNDTTNVQVSANLLATAIPWTNYNGVNPDFDFGETDGPPNPGTPDPIDGTPPFSISVDNASTITVNTLTGTATVNGNAAATPATRVTASNTNPGYYVQVEGTGARPSTATIIIGAFTDGEGNVMAAGAAPLFVSSVVDVGGAIGTPITVPFGAVAFQIGINSTGNTFTEGMSPNSGEFALTATVTTNALPSNVALLGTLTAWYWGDSPFSGAVGQYIWKNPDDPGGSGPTRSTSNAVGSTTGNSFIFDASFGSACTPSQPAGIPGLPGVDISGGTNPKDNPVQWTQLSPESVDQGSVPLYTPAIKGTDGNTDYANFNFCLTGNIYIPGPGTYTFTLTNKDQALFAIGGSPTIVSATGNYYDTDESNLAHSVTLSPTQISSYGQTISVVSGLPLLPVAPLKASGTYYDEDGQCTQTVLQLHFAAAGTYGIELDCDYWDAHGRIFLLMASATAGGPVAIIPPLPANVREDVQYRYVYRSSATGALSNPSPESAQQMTPVLANQITSVWSNDPQIDKVDYYRIDTGLENFTYVATGPNDGTSTVGGVRYNTQITDALTDLEVIDNPVLQFDNYEPFPVVDLPHKGTVNVSGGVISWVSGDQFDLRWLPGTEILIGYPTALAYVFIARPTSVTSVTIPGVPDGTNLIYEIPEPDLAGQPLPYLWGPTDNIAYQFAVGDELNPGTLYFTKGNNPDSAPQTNQIAVTSPAEILMNGCITAGLGMVFSTERRWLIYPTFTTALATVEGVSGTPFNLVLGSSDRGLYIPTCICTDGGSITFFRAKDGIYSCAFGGGDEFICADIYNLFPREGVVPQPITIAGNTIYPPDDTNPSAQTMAYANGYLYYDYQDVNGNPRTLVFDTIAKGWSVDVGEFPFTVHALEEGPETNTVMVGCTDGSVRVLGSGNPEDCMSVVVTASQNSGEARALKRIGDIFLKAIVTATNPVELEFYANRYAFALTGFAPSALVGTGSLAPYIIDFTDGFGDDLIDIGVSLSWPTPSQNILDLWQPDWINLPETVQDRATDWSSSGTQEQKFIQGVRLERNTFGANKVFAIQSGDDMSLHVPNEMPCNFNGQGIQTFSVAPFLAHTTRIVSTDGVPWNEWGTEYIFQPYPSSCLEWTTELMNYGPGWQHIRMYNITYIASAPVTMTIFFDQWPTIVLANILPATSSQLYPTKTKVQMPANKTKLMGFTLTSTARFRVFKPQLEVHVGVWGRSSAYRIVMPFGGNASDGAQA